MNLEVKKSIKMTPFASQNTVSITFTAVCETLKFFATGELGCFPVIEVDLLSGVKLCTHVSSPVMIDREKKVRDEEVRQAVKNFLL
ncbi:hypothetical protein AVEN_110381-1 [Araneus ventricosus]|uniref:Uncharacterized protein n=1 Tax=Araneus ventricosus TaxID=182803 RepID=A0A4Y2ENY1_ARAVE|nr:hypothetical protein AVEN_110381-1 [Araneus ventricosus]